MTLDEAIKHAEKVAEEKENEAQDLEYSKLDWKYEANQCSKCAEEHRQLAEWLKELKRLREQEPCIQEKQANADKIDAVYIDGFKAGYSQARFDLAPQPCEDLISRQTAINAIENEQKKIMRSDWDIDQAKFSAMSEIRALIADLPSAGLKGDK